MLSNNDYNVLRIFRSKNVGPSTFFKILKFFNGKLQDAVDNIDDFNRINKIKNTISLISKNDIDAEIVACSSIGAKIITYNNEIYPKLLKEVINFPPILTLLGNEKLLDKNSISIVGSRNASSNGCNFAKKIAKEVGEAGYVVTSGFASGIDTSAHKGALDTGTVAVFGGGIDCIYPSGNEELYYQIKNKGLIISEFPYHSSPKSENFPSRNRIVSGMSLAVVIIEAGSRSGTIHTARQAIEQNRELLIVPGNPYDPRCEGSNDLIKNGAVPITCTEDIIEAISSYRINKKEEELLLNDNIDKFDDNDFYNFNEELNIGDESNLKELILSRLNYTPISINLLLNDIESDIKSINPILTELELEEKIKIELGSIMLKY